MPKTKKRELRHKALFEILKMCTGFTTDVICTNKKYIYIRI